MARSPRQALTLVRIALLSGVLVFGAVAFAVRTMGDAPELGPEAARTMRTVGMVIWGLALAGLVGMRLVLRERIERGRDTTLPIIAWALAEGPAVFGGAFFLITGDWTVYMAGVVGLLAAYALFPVPST